MQPSYVENPFARIIDTPRIPPRPRPREGSSRWLFEEPKQTTNGAILLEEAVLQAITGQEILGYTRERRAAQIAEEAEALRRGDILDRTLHGASSNPVHVLNIEHGETLVTAYAKSGKSETAIRETGGVFIESNYVFQDGAWIDQAGKPIEETLRDEGLTPEEIVIVVDRFRTRQERFPILRQQIARHYGIPEKDVPLTADRINVRLNIETGTSTRREFAVSALSEFISFDEVPLTVLRPETNTPDYLSVQQGVQGEIMATTDAMTELMKLGPEHPGAKSFMRIACLDWLIRSGDRGPKNIIYDEKRNKFHAIDNGVSLGLSRSPTAEEAAVEEDLESYGAPIQSIALEITQEFPDWVLDDATVEHLRSIVDDLETHMGRNTDISMEDPAELEARGRGIKLLSSIFRFVYGNKTIANTEALAFIEKLKYLVKHRKPPKLARGKNDDELVASRYVSGIVSTRKPTKTSIAA